MSVLKPAFPNIGVEFVQDETIHNLLSIVGFGADLSEPPELYTPERCNDMGKMLFCSEVNVTNECQMICISSFLKQLRKTHIL